MADDFLLKDFGQFWTTLSMRMRKWEQHLLNIGISANNISIEESTMKISSELKTPLKSYLLHRFQTLFSRKRPLKIAFVLKSRKVDGNRLKVESLAWHGQINYSVCPSPNQSHSKSSKSRRSDRQALIGKPICCSYLCVLDLISLVVKRGKYPKDIQKYQKWKKSQQEVILWQKEKCDFSEGRR